MDDALDHEQIAKAITRHLDSLPTGSVLALQGSWGRGKTNVLRRVFTRFEQRAATGGPKPLWLDPWKYGTPDLITPVVLNLLAEIPDRRDMKEVAESLLRAGSAVLFKVVSLVAPPPLAGVVGAAEQPITDMLDKWLSHGPDIEPDPVVKMATRFAELVDKYVGSADGQLLICIDDLDRCLPDHQVAMLEAIHFLTSAQARCSFLIALDPLLVQQAAITHYRTAGFDSNKYLDKLFTLRLRLPELSTSSVERLLASELDGDIARVLADGLGVTVAQVADAFGEIFDLPELRNPRLIHRVCERLRLLAGANAAEERPDQRLVGRARLAPIVTWCAIADRWPELRQLLQDTPPQMWESNVRLVCFAYGFSDVFGDDRPRLEIEAEILQFSNVPDRLPGKRQQPDLGEFLIHKVLAEEDFLTMLAEADAAMIRFGL